MIKSNQTSNTTNINTISSITYIKDTSNLISFNPIQQIQSITIISSIPSNLTMTKKTNLQFLICKSLTNPSISTSISTNNLTNSSNTISLLINNYQIKSNKNTTPLNIVQKFIQPSQLDEWLEIIKAKSFKHDKEILSIKWRIPANLRGKILTSLSEYLNKALLYDKNVYKKLDSTINTQIDNAN